MKPATQIDTPTNPRALARSPIEQLLDRAFYGREEDATIAARVEVRERLNQHAKLVAALRGLMNEHGHVRECGRTTPPDPSRPCRQTCEQARTALANEPKGE